MKTFTNVTIILLSILLFYRCSSDFDDKVTPYLGTNKFRPQSELAENLEDVFEGEISCIAFIYPFKIIIYDELGYEISQEMVSNNEHFYQLLTNSDPNHDLSISYPITGQNPDGDTFEIASNEALANAIDLCVKQDIINTCNGNFVQCSWIVNPFNLDETAPPSPYQDAVFRVSNDGLIQYIHEGITYRGSWIFYFTQDILHLNIHLSGVSEVSEDWNFDWEILQYDANFYELRQEDRIMILDRQCLPCETLEFSTCQLPNTPDTGAFVLSSFNDCLYADAQIENSQDYHIRFYESLEDATLLNNPICSNAYINTSNPQTLYARWDALNSEAFEIREFNLIVDSCEED